jgi:exosortase H (IPTLxxWG-CTERM-specific)
MPSPAGSTTFSPAVSIWLRYRAQVRFVVLGTVLFVAFNGVLYYPYVPGGLCEQLIQRYLSLLAAVSAAIIALFDPAVLAKDALIVGRFPLRIVMECTALDAQALFAAFVLAFPASWKKKLLGIASGIGVLGSLNILRIVSLYYIGLHWPEAFSRMHEEVWALTLVVAALLCFLVWTQWIAKTTTAPWSTGSHGRAPSEANQ